MYYQLVPLIVKTMNGNAILVHLQFFRVYHFTLVMLHVTTQLLRETCKAVCFYSIHMR